MSKKQEKMSRLVLDIIEFLPDATFAIDNGKRVIAWNRAMEEMTGISKSDMLGRDDYAVPFYGERRPLLIDLVFAPEAEVRKHYDVVRKKGNVFYAEGFVPKVRNGEGAYLGGIASTCLDDKGNTVGVVESIRDITEQKRTEEALKMSENNLRMILDSVKDAIFIHTVSGKIIDVNDRMLEMYGVSREEALLMTIEKDFSVPGSPPYNLPEIWADIRNGEKRVFEWKTRRPHDDSTFYVEVFLNKITLNDEDAVLMTVSDITERKQAERDLLESRERFRSFVEHANDIVYSLTPEGVFTYVSPNWAEILGHDIDSVMGQAFEVFVHPADVPVCRAFLKRTVTTKKKQEGVEYRVRHNNGTWRWHTTNASIIRNTDGDIAFMGIARDITERKKAEEALRKSEEQYRLFFEQSPLGIFHFDKDGIIRECNDNFVNIVGSSKQALVGLNMLTQLRGEAIKSAIRSVISTGKGYYEGDYAFVAAEKTTPVRVLLNRIMSNDEKFVMGVGIVEDITERRQAEGALKESEQKFRTLFEDSRDAIYISTKDGRFIDYNQAYLELFGYTKEEMAVVHAEDFYADPADRDIFKKVMEKEGSVRDYEVKLRRKDGCRMDCLATATARYTGDGNLIGYQGIIRDVTEKKEMTERFRALSIVDDLTGLYNRRGFFALVQQQLKIAERSRKDMLLFFGDLDGMKWINDTLGHQEGDSALVNIATILKEVFRESDIIGRMGGDEFAVLVIDATDQTREVLMNRLYNTLGAHNKREGRKYVLSLSVGTAYYNHMTPSSIDELMAQADKLMYEEKRGGRH